MLLSVLLLLLLSSTQATHFLGTLMTYYPKQTRADGSVTVFVRYKLNFHSCSYSDTWFCSGSCGSSAVTLKEVDLEASGEWCQQEGLLTRLSGGNWINNIQNNVVSWRAFTGMELRKRSDTGRANNSPQSTIMPLVRIPSNCQRDLNLLAFDPDGDNVKCRFGSDSLFECNPCAPPSVLNLSSSCTLSFNGASGFNTNSSINEGPYAVQLVMEDFPRQTITLTNSAGVQETKTANQAISKIPFQFVFQVDPVVPSCTEGLFLPKFLPPTPENKAQLYTRVNQALEISIIAEAENSTISELLFSGPSGMVKNSFGSGNFSLKWIPSVREEGESHPFCQVSLRARCVIVHVGYNVLARVNMKVFSSLTSGGNVNDALLQEIKEELVRLGLPLNTTLNLLKSGSVLVNTTTIPGT